VENCRKPGYVTEKIVNAFRSGAIPIYWGAPDVTRYFNAKAFVDMADFATVDACVNFVKSMTDSVKNRMLEEPALTDDPLINMMRPCQNSENNPAYKRFVDTLTELLETSDERELHISGGPTLG
jgi:hypothetical protein